MHPRYQDWIRYIFDHEVLDPAWYFDMDRPDFVAPPTDYAELLRETFLRAGEDLTAYSDAQVNQGFWFVASPYADFIFSLRDGDVPTPTKVAGIRSIYDLYRDCFANHCAETLGHIDEPGASGLNPICYMFWDICPINYLTEQSDRNELAATILCILEQTIRLLHRARIEGGLHGLGHIASDYGREVRRIIDEFLETAQIDTRLRAYAEQARAGYIL